MAFIDNKQLNAGNIQLPSLAQRVPNPNVQLDFMQDVNTKPMDLTLAGGKTGGMNLSGGGPGGGFDWGNAMNNFSLGAQGITGLAGAYNAYKQMGLLEDQLAMQGNIANRNIANQALTTNRMLDDRASMAAQMTSGAEFGSPEYLKAKKELQTTVSGAPVT